MLFVRASQNAFNRHKSLEMTSSGMFNKILKAQTQIKSLEKNLHETAISRAKMAAWP